MPSWSALNIDGSFDYIEKTFVRLALMLETASGVKVSEDVNPNHTPPFWWLYVGQDQGVDADFDISNDLWTWRMRLVAGYNTQGYEGNLQGTILRLLPRTKNYFKAHRRLVIEPEQETIRFLIGDGTRVSVATPFGIFDDGTNHIGIELELQIQYAVTMEAVY